MPGDKSISHRAAILGAIADQKVTIENFSPSADCLSTLTCLQSLGVNIEREGNTIVVHGVGMRGLSTPAVDLDCGNSGTTMRLLAGILAAQPYASRLTGDDALSSRPMTRIAEPLTKMGALVETTNGHAPLTIRGGELRGISFAAQVPSAQVKSCILLAGLAASGVTVIHEPVPTRDHTERMLREMGAAVETTTDGHISLKGQQAVKGGTIHVPGDISAASFLMVAAACLPGSRLTLRGVGVNPTRSAIIDLLRDAGASIEITNEREMSGEPAADITVCSISPDSRPRGRLLISGGRTAELIDEIPAIAVLGTALSEGIEIRDAAELRIKESDRIAAIVTDLRELGADVTEFDDGFRVGRSVLRGAAVETYGDHRIAMAFAVAGLMAEGETSLSDAACVDVSFPGFFETLESVVNS